MAKFVKIYNGLLNYARTAIVQAQTLTGRRIVLDEGNPRELTTKESELESVGITDKQESVERRVDFSKKDTKVKPVTVQEIKNLMKADDSIWIDQINKGLRGAASAEYPAFIMILPSEALAKRMCELYQKEGFKCLCHVGKGNVSLEFNLGL